MALVWERLAVGEKPGRLGRRGQWPQKPQHLGVPNGTSGVETGCTGACPRVAGGAGWRVFVLGEISPYIS